MKHTSKATVNSLYYQSIVSTRDLTLSQIKLILSVTHQLKNTSPGSLLANKIIAHCFFEPSTRTRLSFETATLRLDGKVIGFDNANHLSITKGETLHDTIRIIADFADLIILRHPREGAARLAASISNKPIINAGDGANQHPTQALIDLFTIAECQKNLDGLSIAFVGDLKYGRTIHSLADLCLLFNIRLFLVSPEQLALPEPICDRLKKAGVRFSFHQSLDEVMSKIDILYMTRVQEERLSQAEYQWHKKKYVLTPSMLATAKPNLKILHPLPRVDEIDIAVDKTSHAHYFTQAANGVFLRQALLTLLLNKALP